MNQTEFEAYIADDFGEHRGELHVEQVTPRYGVRRGAFVRIVDLEPFERVYDGLSERVQQFLNVVPSERVSQAHGSSGDITEEPLDAASYLRICHDSDRTYAGYANIYRALNALAPFLEDARFIIKEDYATWVDEYRVAGGRLSFDRGTAADEYISDLHDHIEAKALARPEDSAWRHFAAWLLADWARYLIDSVHHDPKSAETRGNRRDAEKMLDRATAIDDEHPSVLFQRGRLCQLLGRHEEASEWFEKRRALDDDASTTFEAAMNALSAGSDSRAAELLRELAEAQPDRRAVHQLLAMLADAREDAGASRAHAERAVSLGRHARTNPDKEALHRTGRLRAMIDVYARHAPTTDHEWQRRVLAADLLEWAELFRIKMCHGIREKESRDLASDLYGRALGISDLSGDIHHKKALFLRQARRKGSRAALGEALAINPEHLGALGDLGQEAFEAERWEEAIERLTRYLEVSRGAKASSYYRQMYAGFLVAALVQRGYELLHDGQYEPADALFERAIGLVDELSWTQQQYPGAWVGRSDAHTYLLRHEEALVFADRALELDDASAHAWSARGSCLNNLGRFDEAMDCYERAIGVDAGYFHPYYCKACTLTLTGGDRAEIFQLLRKASKLDPTCRDKMKTEPDFRALRDDPEFQRLIGAP